MEEETSLGTSVTVNLRDMPADAIQRAKAIAALKGMTLKDYIIMAIQHVNSINKDLLGNGK